MIGRTITFKVGEYYITGIVFDKIKIRNNSAAETRYLVKLIKDDLDFDDESANVAIVDPTNITNID